MPTLDAPAFVKKFIQGLSIFPLHYQEFGLVFGLSGTRIFEILSFESMCLWKKHPVSLYYRSLLALGRASSRNNSASN